MTLGVCIRLCHPGSLFGFGFAPVGVRVCQPKLSCKVRSLVFVCPFRVLDLPANIFLHLNVWDLAFVLLGLVCNPESSLRVWVPTNIFS